MNTLILNRDTFELPGDGWYQVAPLGQFPHRPSGAIQVVDEDACDAMCNAFTEQAKQANFAGLLIDFDHFSLDDKLKSEAAGWIVGLENRDPRDEGGNLKPEEEARANGGGLWAKIRWSDLGEEAVKGGRYRFLSPVWSQRDCIDLGDGRLRPVRLLNAAVTNDPNLKGMVPLSNRGRMSGVGCRKGGPTPPSAPLPGGDRSISIANAGRGAGEQHYKWTLGDSPEGRHCPTCVELAGQVHTMPEWEEAGLGPGGDGLYCQGNCHCSLVKTDDPATGNLNGAPVRKEDGGAEEGVMADRNNDLNGTLANIGWTDAARAASLAVRQAKAAARRAAREAAGTDAGGGSDGDDMTQEEYELERLTREMDNYRGMAESAFKQEYGYFPTTPEEIAEGEDLANVPDEYRTDGEMTPAELAEMLLEDDRAEENVSAMSPEDVEKLTSEIREKLRSGERLDPDEEAFLQQLSDSGYAGESDSDPVFNWMERKSMERSQSDESDQQWSVDEIHGRAEELMARQGRGESLSDDDREFLARYVETVGNRGGGQLGNKGWSDEARAASLAVRRAKAAARKVGAGKLALHPPSHEWIRDVPEREDEEGTGGAVERHPLYPPDEEGTGDIPKPGDEESGPGIGRGSWPYPELPDWWPGGGPDLPIFWPGGTPEFDEGFGRPVWPPPWPIRPEPVVEPESDPEPKPEPVPVPEMHPPYNHFPGSTGDPYVGTRGVYRGPTGNLFTIEGVGPSAVERPVNDPSAWRSPGLNVKGPAPTFYRGSYPRIWGPKDAVEDDKGRRRDFLGRQGG